MLRRLLILCTMFLAGCATAADQLHPAAFQSDRIHIETVGSGPDVILVPGMGSSAEIWRDTVEAVPGYRYHLVQVAGFAGAPAGGNSPTEPVLAPIAQEISRYIEEASLSAPAIIGHSMGGTVAMMVATGQPRRVSKLMVVDMLPFLGALYAPGASSEGIDEAARKFQSQMLSRSEAERQAATEAGIAAMIRNPNKRAAAVQQALESDAPLMARVMRDLIGTDLRNALCGFAGPARILYVRGPNMPLTDEQVDQLYKLQFQCLRQAGLRRIPDSYHFIMLDRPDIFADEVRAFLAH